MPYTRLAMPFIALSLAACNALPRYQPATGEAMNRVRVLGQGEFTMCKDGVRYKLPIDQPTGDSAYFQVPAGERIGISAYLSQQGYQKIIYCSTGLSFIPKAGEAYVTNSGFHDKKCFIELVGQDDSRDTGVKQDLTVDFYRCNVKLANPEPVKQPGAVPVK